MKEKEKQKDIGGSGDKSTILPPFGLAEEILGTRSESSSTQKDPNKSGGNGGNQDNIAVKYVTFFLGDEEYALPITQVQEINRVVEITRVPNSREHVMGVINLRGKIIPVIELRKRLNLESGMTTKSSRIVIVEHGPKVLGLMVDSVSQVLNISSDQIEAAPEEAVQVDRNCIKGVGKIDSRMILMLDLEQIIVQKTKA